MKRAFTLIELLVVIAIIAILAAILFPVFAQAKAAAKSAADLSNLKQSTLGILMYCGDYDDNLPQAFDKNYTPGLAWPVTTQPYAKSYAIYKSPFDGGKLTDLNGNGLSEGGWGGIAISYACNSYMDGGWPKVIRGPMVNNSIYSGWGMGDPTSMSQTSITKIAETILLTDRFTSDLTKLGSAYVGNTSAWTGNSFIWNDYDDQTNGARIPVGTVDKTKAWPNGPNGGVSVTTASKANFSLSDGHAKSYVPAATDPDPSNSSDKNMWDATR
jgi:prepilin-type N-terminal cleavage/methylation domain-containing protein